MPHLTKPYQTSPKRSLPCRTSPYHTRPCLTNNPPWRKIVTKGGYPEGAGYGVWAFYEYATNELVKVDFYDGTTRYTTGEYYAKANEWHQAVMTAVTGSASFYLNGAFKETISVGAYLNEFPLMIARRTGAYDYFNGLVGLVRVYNRALTAAEISDLYNIRRNITNGCVLKLGSLGLIRGGGTQWLDESPYKNHGTVYGAKRVRCCHCNPVVEYGT